MSYYKDFLNLPLQSLGVNLLRALLALSLVKVVVIYGGAAALASLSNYQNYIGILALIVTLSSQTGLTVLSSKKSLGSQPLLVSLKIVLLNTPLVIVIAWLNSKTIVLDNDLLNAKDYFLYSSIILIPFALNILLVAHQIAMQAYRNIFVNYLLVGIIPLAYFLFFDFFIISNLLLVMSIANWAGFLYLFFKTNTKLLSLFSLKLDKSIAKHLLRYGFMSGVLGLCFSLIMISSRKFLAMEVDIYAAGQWDALLKIGILFQLLVATPIVSTGLPILVNIIDSKISLIKDFLLIRLRLLVFITFVSILIALFFSKTIVLVLYSYDFMSISSLISVIIISEGLRAIANLLFLVPIAFGKTTKVIIFNSCFAAFILVGLFFLSSMSAINIENVAWLYLAGSFVLFLFTLLSTLIWFRNHGRINAF